MIDDSNVYHGDWCSMDDVREEFAGTRRGPACDLSASDDVLFAWYEYANYEGEAFVLFRREGLMYEVYGSHCSCHGLEDQWTPEESSLAELTKRVNGDWPPVCSPSALAVLRAVVAGACGE